jgi:hypothetical protein
MFSDPEWASKEEWDTYAWYGFTIQNAQHLERFLHIILASLTMSQKNSDSVEIKWETLYDKCGRLTLGQLLNNVKKYTEFPANLVENIKKAVSLRNELAHYFFLPKGQGSKDTEIEVQKRLMETASYFSNLMPQIESLMMSLLESLYIDRIEAENKLDNFINSKDIESANL